MGFTNIMTAVAQGTPEDVKYFVEQKNADVNTKDAKGVSLLHAAAARGMVELAEFLISKGAVVDARNSSGTTPLYLAIYHGNVELAKVLISHGADVNATAAMGMTPLLAMLCGPAAGSTELAKELLSNGANVNAKQTTIGFTPLHLASTAEIAKMFISAGADVNARNVDDETPLHSLVASRDNVDIIKVLVDGGANVNARTKEGVKALAIARTMRKTVIAEYLSSFETSSPSSRSTSSSGGCYIATAVYKSYDAPEVLCLRRFRDDILSASIFGRIFIKLYYLFSPAIAERLKKTRRINMFVRMVLDMVVVRLNKNVHN